MTETQSLGGVVLDRAHLGITYWLSSLYLVLPKSKRWCVWSKGNLRARKTINSRGSTDTRSRVSSPFYLFQNSGHCGWALAYNDPPSFRWPASIHTGTSSPLQPMWSSQQMYEKRRAAICEVISPLNTRKASRYPQWVYRLHGILQTKDRYVSCSGYATQWWKTTQTEGSSTYEGAFIPFCIYLCWRGFIHSWSTSGAHPPPDLCPAPRAIHHPTPSFMSTTHVSYHQGRHQGQGIKDVGTRARHPVYAGPRSTTRPIPMWARSLVFTHPSNPCDSVKSTTLPVSSPTTAYLSRKPTTMTRRYMNALTTSVSTPPHYSMLPSSVLLAPSSSTAYQSASEVNTSWFNIHPHVHHARTWFFTMYLLISSRRMSYVDWRWASLRRPKRGDEEHICFYLIVPQKLRRPPQEEDESNARWTSRKPSASSGRAYLRRWRSYEATANLSYHSVCAVPRFTRLWIDFEQAEMKAICLQSRVTVDEAVANDVVWLSYAASSEQVSAVSFRYPVLLSWRRIKSVFSLLEGHLGR